MSPLRRLDVRLFLSYALVAVILAAVITLIIGVVAPPLFATHLTMMMANGMGGMGAMHANQVAATQDAFSSALVTALLIALAAAVLAAALISAWMARRILRPISAVQHATRRLAAGHYDERVPIPRETELAALALDVNRLTTTLEHTERRRGELISEVAHELRSPLTTIEGYLEGMLDGVFEPTAEVFVAGLDEVSRLKRLAADLSALSRLDEGALHLQPEPADLAELTARTAKRLRPQYDDKGVTLEVHASAPLPVTVDTDRIAQVLTNLLGNALTYTPTGGRVDLTTRAETGNARVEIADTGIGMNPDELDHAFERFYRAPGVPRPPGGSGIGLTIARGIARAHGGDIHATSPGRGHGATFTLRLPSARPAHPVVVAGPRNTG